MGNQKVYVSLTTTKARIDNIKQTIDSIVDQLVKPTKIKLYISKEPYLLDEGIKEKDIPAYLKKLKRKGLLEIIYTENIGPYRKIIPILKENWKKECIIITADDDVIYPKDWTEKLLKASIENPTSIISMRNRYISIKRKKLTRYQSWRIIDKQFADEYEKKLSPAKIFPTGRGGILYKPSFFDEKVFDKQFIKICPYGDDIWIKFISLANGINNKIAFSDYFDLEFPNTANSSKSSLYNINVNGKNEQNNTQIKKVLDYLKERYDINIINLILTKEEQSMKRKSTESPKRLPGTFWGITTFFNPAGYKNKYQNYKIFREKSKKQGLKLCTVELAFGNTLFELKKEDAEILIQLRGNEKNIMWQKEAMLNIALKNLPKNCDKIAWIDCDIIFKNKNWIRETSKLLERYKVIQPFSIVSFNSEKGHTKKEKNKQSLAYTRYCFNNRSGHPGLAWTARKEIFEDIGFYDKLILGMADVLLGDAFYSPIIRIPPEYHSEQMITDMSKYWCILSKRVNRSVFYLKGGITHLWHGKFKNRRYKKRAYILKNNKFNPNRDIKKNVDGIWEWCTKKLTLEVAIKDYFHARNEENKAYKEPLQFIYDLKYILNLPNYQRNILLKKDFLLGKAGATIKKLSPKTYKYLTKRKPSWAKPIAD